MAKPVHSMIRVFDEAKSLDYYQRAFGLEVADHLKFPDVRLVGQSMGGWTVLEYAIAHPAKVKALVLSSTSGTLDRRGH